MAIKVGMVSLGCPKNQCDAELMLARLEAAGMELVGDAALADVVIINTCGFIEAAKAEAIENILEFVDLKKEGQIKKVIVTGCMAERYREEVLREIPECDAVLGLGANKDIVEAVERTMQGDRFDRFPDKSEWTLDGSRVQTTPHFFAYLRIADGCNNRCAYCAIPMIRGNLRSRKLETLVEEAQALVQNGVREITLVAQDTTVYGQDLYGRPHIVELLNELCKIEDLRWIRLLYCYPEHITDELLDTMAKQDKIVKYMDIPLQHASKHVLRAMRRAGDRASLTALMQRIREKVPGIVLRTTVMTGFPGETEEDFEELCGFIKEVRFDRLGCFAFSTEEGTPAADLPDQLPQELREDRRDIVMETQARIAAELNEQMVGRTLEVMVESYDRYAECWFGRSAGDAPDIDGKVFFTAKKGSVHPGDFIRVRVDEVYDWDLYGEVVK